MLIKHLWLRCGITSDKEKEKQGRDTVWASEEKSERVREPADKPSGSNCVCWWNDKSDIPQVCWSTASLGHLSVPTWNSRWPLHSAVCSFTQQDHTWQVKSLWTVLLLLMASWSWRVWVCIHLQGKMWNKCKNVKRYAQNIQNITCGVLVWLVKQRKKQKKTKGVCLCEGERYIYIYI